MLLLIMDQFLVSLMQMAINVIIMLNNIYLVIPGNYAKIDRNVTQNLSIISEAISLRTSNLEHSDKLVMKAHKNFGKILQMMQSKWYLNIRINNQNNTNHHSTIEYLKTLKTAFISKNFNENMIGEKKKEYEKLSASNTLITKNGSKIVTQSFFLNNVLYDRNGFNGFNNLIFDICLHREKWTVGYVCWDLTYRYEFTILSITKDKMLLKEQFHHNNPTDTTVRKVRFVEINF